ncbi:MAG: SHOCT domain-containing protein [Bacillota bacterium]|nr:SHOCT domain-containing protein [Bacillota bacterium]
MEKLLEYSIQLAMLSSLLDEKLISEREYAKIKVELERKYRIKTKIAG